MPVGGFQGQEIGVCYWGFPLEYGNTVKVNPGDGRKILSITDIY